MKILIFAFLGGTTRLITQQQPMSISPAHGPADVPQQPCCCPTVALRMSLSSPANVPQQTLLMSPSSLLGPADVPQQPCCCPTVALLMSPNVPQ